MRNPVVESLVLRAVEDSVRNRLPGIVDRMIRQDERFREAIEDLRRANTRNKVPAES